MYLCSQPSCSTSFLPYNNNIWNTNIRNPGLPAEATGTHTSPTLRWSGKLRWSTYGYLVMKTEDMFSGDFSCGFWRLDSSGFLCLKTGWKHGMMGAMGKLSLLGSFGSGPRAHFDANDRAATRRSTCWLPKGPGHWYMLNHLETAPGR